MKIDFHVALDIFVAKDLIYNHARVVLHVNNNLYFDLFLAVTERIYSKSGFNNLIVWGLVVFTFKKEGIERNGYGKNHK